MREWVSQEASGDASPPATTGEIIQFGGLGARWPFRQVRFPRLPHLPTNLASAAIALATLAVGLPIGFFGGLLTAHPNAHAARPAEPTSTSIVVPEFATSGIALTGARCALQVGNNLQLGVEITNETRHAITLGAIHPLFPLGGLRAISSGARTCGELPQTSVVPAGPLAPEAAQWIETTVAVRLACPEPLPVWFRVGYTDAGKPGTALLAGFPDLGPVSYRHCKFTGSGASSIIIATVEPATNHLSRR